MSETVPLPMFTAPAYGGRTFNNLQRCVNLYPEVTGESRHLLTAPGLDKTGTTPNNAACRGYHYAAAQAGALYSVHGDTVYRIQATGTVMATLGTLNTSSGNVYMASSETEVLLVDGNDGWVININSGSLTRITDGNFPTGPAGAVYHNGYFMVAKNGTERFYLSQINQAGVWTPEQRNAAESSGDILLGPVRLGDNILLFGQRSVEPWYLTENASFPFERITGGTIDFGVPDLSMVAEIDGRIFFPGTGTGGRGGVWMISGSERRKISTPVVEEAIGAWVYGSVFGFCYKDSGRSFYQVTNATVANGPCWVYCIESDAWFERDSNISDVYGAHRVRGVANAFQQNGERPIAFDRINGNIYYFGGQNDEDGTAIRRIRSFGPIAAGGKTVFHYRIVFNLLADHDASASYTLSADLRWTDDGGKTWSASRTLSADITSGTTGQYIRLSTNRLGSSRNRFYELTLTGPSARLQLESAELDMEIGKN